MKDRFYGSQLHPNTKYLAISEDKKEYKFIGHRYGYSTLLPSCYIKLFKLNNKEQKVSQVIPIKPGVHYTATRKEGVLTSYTFFYDHKKLFYFQIVETYDCGSNFIQRYNYTDYFLKLIKEDSGFLSFFKESLVFDEPGSEGRLKKTLFTSCADTKSSFLKLAGFERACDLFNPNYSRGTRAIYIFEP